MAALYDQPPPAGALPWRSLLKRSAIIVLRNLHHLLYLSALCFLLSYLLITAFTSLPSLLSDPLLFLNFTGLAFLTYILTAGEPKSSLKKSENTPIKSVDSAADVHQLYDAPAASRGTKLQVCFTLAFMVFSIMSVVNGTQAYLEAAKMVEICRDFGIVVLLGTLGWAMYAAQRLARTSSDAGGENMLMQEPALQKGAGESYNSRSAAIACSMRSIGRCMVKVSMWVIGVAYALTFIWWSSGGGEQVRHARTLSIIGALAVGVSVLGLPAVLWAGVLSTKASLDMSIRQFYSAIPTSPHVTALTLPLVS